MACGGCGKRTAAGRDEDTRKWMVTTRLFSARVETDRQGTILCAGVHLASWRGKPFNHLVMWIQSLENPQMSVRRML